MPRRSTQSGCRFTGSTPAIDRLFFFNDTATTEIYTLSLHDALPIYHHHRGAGGIRIEGHQSDRGASGNRAEDRKSTRLNSSHANISYAVFCLKKKTR